MTVHSRNRAERRHPEKVPTFWDVPTTAEVLGVTENTLRAWIVTRKAPPSYKVGRLRKFRPDEVEAWLQERRDVSA
jgi:excisionase family DNA binding protein